MLGNEASPKALAAKIVVRAARCPHTATLDSVADRALGIWAEQAVREEGVACWVVVSYRSLAGDVGVVSRVLRLWSAAAEV